MWVCFLIISDYAYAYLVCEEIFLVRFAKRAEQMYILGTCLNFHWEIIEPCLCHTTLLVFNINWESLYFIFRIPIEIARSHLVTQIAQEIFKRVRHDQTLLFILPTHRYEGSVTPLEDVLIVYMNDMSIVHGVHEGQKLESVFLLEHEPKFCHTVWQ